MGQNPIHFDFVNERSCVQCHIWKGGQGKEQVCDKNRISGCPKVHHDRCSSLYVVLTSTLLSTTSKRDRKVQFRDWLLLSRWEIEWIMKELVLMLIFLSCIVFHLSSPWAQIALDAVATATARCELYLSVKSIYPNAMMHPSDILDRVANGHKDQQCDVAIVARTHTQTLTRKHRHTNTHIRKYQLCPHLPSISSNK